MGSSSKKCSDLFPLTAGELEVAHVLVKRVETKLHAFANDGEVGSGKEMFRENTRCGTARKLPPPQLIVDAVLLLDLKSSHFRYHLRLIKFDLERSKDLLRRYQRIQRKKGKQRGSNWFYHTTMRTNQVMDDEIWSPEEVYETCADRLLSLGPVGRGVEDHAGLGPQQLVV